MNRLASALADRIRSRIGAGATTEGAREIRLIFLGPPHELMFQVFEDLTRQPDSIELKDLPFLLQVPREELPEGNPAVGASGWCDEDHLLDLRNLPRSASFVALIPPGEHSILSVGSTTDKFGVAESNNGGNTTFEAWWDDSFIQSLVVQALSQAGVSDALVEDGRRLVEAAARAADEVEAGNSPREGAWRVLSRLFSINAASGLQPGVAISLACGFPPMRNGVLAAREQIGTLKSIAEAMSEGFRRSVERLSDGASDEDQRHLAAYLEHVRSVCEVATTFERATPAYYRPAGQLALPAAPDWWVALDVEKWTELLAEGSPDGDPDGDIAMTCSNSLAALGKSMPVIVSGQVDLQIETNGGDPNGGRIGVNRTPAAGNGLIGDVASGSVETLSDPTPPTHKLPLTYRAMAQGFNPRAQYRTLASSPSWICLSPVQRAWTAVSLSALGG